MKNRGGGHDGVVLEAMSYSNIKLVMACLRIANKEGQWQKDCTVKTNEDHCRPDEDPLQLEFQNPKVEEEDTELGEDEA